MRRKMLVLDIDGTLTNSRKEITPRTRERILEIQRQGHIVVLASGRPTPGMARMADALELEKYGGYLLSFNGARITNRQTGEIVCQNELPGQYIAPLYDFAVAEDIGLVTYASDAIVTGLRHDEYTELESRINGIPIRDVDHFVEYVDFPVNKCLFTAPVDRAPELERRLAAQFVGRLSVYRSEPFFIEVMPLHVDKAASLERLLNRLDMRARDVIACGDGFNDLSMIRFAGLGVAMANAQESVKREADYVTLSNDEDGVAHVIEKFILKI